MRCGNAFGRVCLAVCPYVCAVRAEYSIFEPIAGATSFFHVVGKARRFEASAAAAASGAYVRGVLVGESPVYGQSSI